MSGRGKRVRDADAAPGCRCGHTPEHHEHLRKGTDCGVCGPEKCPRYVAARQIARPAFWRRWSMPARRGQDATVLEHPTRVAGAAPTNTAAENERRRTAGSS